MLLLNSNLDYEPQFITSKGAYLIDSNGGTFFDTWLGSGTLIFGHEIEFQDTDLLLPAGPNLDQLFLDSIKDSVEFNVGAFGLQTSGSSAVSRAIRLARAATKKNRIVVIGSFWHGSENEFLFKNDKSRISSGLTVNSHSDVEWYPTLQDALANIEVEKTAGILIEPYQGADPGSHLFVKLSENWRQFLRTNNILLICDEIITGFRERYGSCDVSRTVEPDIVIFGKAVGGGYPVGVVLVNKIVIDSYDFELPFWGGTFSASPVQIKSIESALKRLKILNYDALKNNLKTVLAAIEEHIVVGELKLKSGCNFARIARQTDNTARSFVTADQAFENLRKDLLKHASLFVGHNGLVFPSIFEY